MGSESHSQHGHRRSAMGLVLLMLLLPLSHIHVTKLEQSQSVQSSNSQPWDDRGQPWGQYGGGATRNGSMPIHNATSGNVLSIDDPVLNWVALDDGIGSDAYGSIIGNFSGSLTVSPGAIERCTPSALFAVILHESTSTSTTKLSLFAGDDAALSWQVELGDTRAARSTPVLVDVNLDGRTEIIVVYDTDSSLQVDVWSPELFCDESGWQVSGHANELLWSWTNADYRIGVTSPHFQTRQSNHLSVTQPLLADLELDGQPELVLTVVDSTTDDPHILSIPLGANTPTENWDVTLDRGTHPSDPAWAQLDAQNSVVVATTIDENSGNMWIWRIDGSTGSNDWGRLAIAGTDTDSDAPRLRLPSPVIAQLDTDDAPEMILTVPTDANGRTLGLGARFIGMELTSTQEVFTFRARNGYADAPPLPVDLDQDGVHDRLCWVTWYSASSVTFDREGMVGCHDLTESPPTEEWTKVMNRGGSGNDNDEIAVSPPAWMDIDGEGDPEIVVAFGKRIFAYEGDTGFTNEVSDGWDEPLSMPHRVWSAPAFADLDNDGYLDILYGDTLVSQRMLDLAPLEDGNGISFNPVSPDPGQTLTVTGQFANIGTWENDDSIDCALYMDGQEISRVRIDELEPLSPSGEGGPETFSVDVTATLGTHMFELILDVNQNLTEAREDNNVAYANLTVVEPYAVVIQGPETVPRIDPGTSASVNVSVTATGSRTASWDISYDATNLPDGWTVEPKPGTSLQDVELAPLLPFIVPFTATLPNDALGDEDGYIEVIATLVSDPSIEATTLIAIEALRTRGLSLVGPTGLANSHGYGIPGYVAETYVLIENLGNAVETTTSIDWTSPSWGGSPVLFDGTNNVYSITLEPGELMELKILLDVPSSIALGSTTTTTLTTCIGSGEETLCRSLDANFTSTASHASPTHIRTVPSTTHQFEFHMLLPSSGTLSWDLNQANIALPNWQWNVSGGGTLVNDVLTASGTGGTYHTVELEFYIPPNAAPQRLSFQTEEQNLPENHDFALSVHVLQIHRSNLVVINPQPSPEAIGFNVSTNHQILIQLENPGNGEDTYKFEARVVPTDDVSAEDVAFTYYNPQRTLGPLATTIMPLDIVLNETLPASNPFYIEFEWSSLINKSVSATTMLLVEAEQRHDWEVVVTGGNQQTVQPMGSHILEFEVKNIGNFVDDVQLIPELSVTTSDNDTAVWQIHDTIESASLEVNATSNLTVVQEIPYAWKDAEAKLTYSIVSAGYELGQFEIDLIVQEHSEWGVNLADSDLEIMPGGDYIQVQIEQKGNSPSTPFLTKYGQGWNITLPNGSLMEPGQTTIVDIYVESPKSAREGDVNVLEIRISDATGNGMEVFQVPVRVIRSSSYNLQKSVDWFVSSEGGFPLAWVENTGNDMPRIELEVLDLPEGWSAVIDASIELTPGQIKGLPIKLAPPEDWDGVAYNLTVQLIHSELGAETIPFTVRPSNISFSSSPVLWSRVGTLQSVDVNNPLNNQITQESGESFDSNLSFAVQSGVTYVNLSTGEDLIQFVLIGKETPLMTVSCSFINEAFNNLGQSDLTGDFVACEVVGDPEVNTKLSYIVTTNRGDNLPLVKTTYSVLVNQSMNANLSVSNWDPQPGNILIMVHAYDEYGNLLSSISRSVVSRESGWNLGISSVSAKGEINVAISRTNYEVLVDGICKLTVTSRQSDFEEVVLIDAAGPDFKPNNRIDGVGLEDNEQLDVALACNTPFDIDDDLTDNTASVIFEAEETPVLSSSNLIWAVSVATILIGMYLFVVQRKDGMIEQRSSEDKPTSVKEPQNQQAKPIEPVTDEIEQSNEDVSFDDESIELIELPTMIEEIPIEDDLSPSGRLDSIRKEMNPESEASEESSIEDRMSKFFN